MNLQEYQAKSLLSGAGVAVPRGRVAHTPDEADAAAREIDGPVVVKAQVLAGARGKAGGVKRCATPEAAAAAAASMIGRHLVTLQSGPKGDPVEAVLVEEQVPIARELFLAYAIDRALGCETVIASASGGMEVEEIAKRDPKAILRESITPASGIWPFQVRTLTTGLDLKGRSAQAFHETLRKLLTLFRELDCSLL